MKNAALRRHFFLEFLLLRLSLVLALLVRNPAAGLAGGLAGCLALTASAVLRALAQIPGIQSLNVFHGTAPFNQQIPKYFTTAKQRSQTLFFLSVPSVLQINHVKPAPIAAESQCCQLCSFRPVLPRTSTLPE